MPIQYPNFNFPIQRALMPTPDYSGIVNFIPQALQAYKQTGEAMLSPYEQRHTKMMNEEKLRKQAFENALMQEFGAREKRAEIGYKEAQIQDLLGGLSQNEKTINRLYGEGTPQAKQALALALGTQNVPFPGSMESIIANTDFSGKSYDELKSLEKEDIEKEKRGVFSTGQRYSQLGTNERLAERKRMDSDLAKADASKGIIREVQELRDLNNKYPNMQKTFSALFLNPDDYGALKQIGSFLVDKPHERAAVELFRKKAQKLANHQSVLMGGTRGASDARLHAVERTKGSVQNTLESNNAVFDDMIREALPNIGYGEALRNSLNSTDPTVIYPDERKYTDRVINHKKHYGIEGPLSQADFEKQKDKGTQVEKIIKQFSDLKLNKEMAGDIYDTSIEERKSIQEVVGILLNEGVIK